MERDTKRSVDDIMNFLNNESNYGINKLEIIDSDRDHLSNIGSQLNGSTFGSYKVICEGITAMVGGMDGATYKLLVEFDKL